MQKAVRMLSKGVLGIAMLIVGSSAALAQTTSSITINVSDRVICIGTQCRPITRVPEIDAGAGKLAVALVGVAMLLSAELVRRRT